MTQLLRYYNNENLTDWGIKKQERGIKKQGNVFGGIAELMVRTQFLEPASKMYEAGYSRVLYRWSVDTEEHQGNTILEVAEIERDEYGNPVGWDAAPKMKKWLTVGKNGGVFLANDTNAGEIIGFFRGGRELIVGLPQEVLPSRGMAKEIASKTGWDIGQDNHWIVIRDHDGFSRILGFHHDSNNMYMGMHYIRPSGSEKANCICLTNGLVRVTKDMTAGEELLFDYAAGASDITEAFAVLENVRKRKAVEIDTQVVNGTGAMSMNGGVASSGGLKQPPGSAGGGLKQPPVSAGTSGTNPPPTSAGGTGVSFAPSPTHAMKATGTQFGWTPSFQTGLFGGAGTPTQSTPTTQSFWGNPPSAAPTPFAAPAGTAAQTPLTNPGTSTNTKPVVETVLGDDAPGSFVAAAVPVAGPTVHAEEGVYEGKRNQLLREAMQVDFDYVVNESQKFQGAKEAYWWLVGYLHWIVCNPGRKKPELVEPSHFSSFGKTYDLIEVQSNDSGRFLKEGICQIHTFEKRFNWMVSLINHNTGQNGPKTT